jgi:hypothetical protein
MPPQRGKWQKEACLALNSPQEITLAVKWEALPLSPTVINAGCINGDYAYDMCNLYDPQASQDSELAIHSRYQAVSLRYQGHGAYRLASANAHAFTGYELADALLVFENGSLLATHSFQTQTLSPLILRRRLVAEQTWLVTLPYGTHAGQINVTPYYGYGVYAKAGSPLGSIEQIYARLTTHGSRTAVDLKRASALQQQGLGPPIGGKRENSTIIYPGTFRDMNYSLSEAIAAGVFRFNFQCQDEIIAYQSLRYTQRNPRSQLFDIVFAARV